MTTSVRTTPVRFIDAFVDGLDLAATGFDRVEPKVTGRRGYATGRPSRAGEAATSAGRAEGRASAIIR
jgi:hypothetical protein